MLNYYWNKQKKKIISQNYIRVTEILKDVMIKKEIDKKVDAYKKQLRCKYMKLMN